MFVERHELTGKDGAPLNEPTTTDIAKVLVALLHRNDLLPETLEPIS